MPIHEQEPKSKQMTHPPRLLVLAVFALGVLLLASCTTIVVDADDSSPPEFIVTLVNASSLDAAYTTGAREEIRGQIDTSQPFHVTASRDRQSIQLLFTAVDQQSSIRSLRASLEASFHCATRVIGGDVSKDATATFSEDSLTPADPGDEVSDRRAIGVDFTLEDLWRRGGCTTWDAFSDVNSGRLSNIEVQYSATATNNSRPAGPSGTANVTGKFTVANASVNLDR